MKRPSLLEIVESLNDSIDLQEMLPSAHQRLSRLIPADYAALCVSRPGQPGTYEWMVAQLPEAWFSAYPEMEAYDFVRQTVLSRPNIVLRDDEMIPRTQLERNMMYQRGRELGVHLEHVMAVMLDTGGGRHGGFMLYRDVRRPFSETDRRTLQQLVPHLVQAVRNSQLLGEAAGRGHLLERLFEVRGAEVVVWDATGREVLRSEGATGLLERWFPRTEPWRNGLPGVLGDRLAEKLRSGPGEGEDRWERTGPDVVLRATFVRVDRQCAAVLEEVSLRRRPPRSWAEKLTARELEVVSRVLEGWDNQLIADDLRCALTTVKKHLQHIFDKLGVSSRAALTALAGRSP